MESRLKERLTGAAILVALIVLIVPEVFHGRRSAPAPASVVTAARAGAHPTGASAAPTRSYTVELAPEPPATRAPPAAEAGRPAAATSEPARPASAASAAVAASPPRPREASVSSGHSRSGAWSVQLGLFAKAANAERLAQMAQRRGFAVETSRFGPRRLYRVAVAGIPDRASAEQLSHRLRDAGLPAAILGPR